MRPRKLRPVFATRDYAYLADRLCEARGFVRGEVEVRTFPDGERYQRVLTSVDDRHVVVVGGTVSDASTLELYDLCSGLVVQGAESLTMVVPWFGYSTMERAVLPGEVVTAKTRARLLSSIPLASAGNRILLLDLHVPGLTYYFEGSLVPLHVYGKPLVAAAVRELAGDVVPVIACTDAGRAKWVESLANDLGLDASFVFKRRVDGARTQVRAVSAQVQGRLVIIYDDMIRTGSSLVGAARAYRDAGASRIAAVATHGVFPGDALRDLEDTGLFEAIVVSDSHPRVLELEGAFLRVKTVAPLLLEALARPHYEVRTP